MSRGGRGGFRGGRGRGGRGGGLLKGATWENDEEVKPDSTPSAIFPENRLIPQKPLTKSERQQIAHYRRLRARVHEGPLYTVLGDNVRVGKTQALSAAAQRDPFESMPRYSDKYKKKTRRIPRLDTRPYVLKFFPKELWSTLDPSQASKNGTSPTSTRKKRLKIATGNTVYGLEDPDIEGEGDEYSSLARRGFLASLTAGDDDEEEAEAKPDEDIPEEPEEQDNDYEDDEDDMAGDYNAEQYFDTGGDDAGEDYDGGDGGGEYD
ncbi:MAG: hypothetical protein M1812_007675 [Candelaria pacifica]|nr:MAG: hypothetical protein M1812_007675 [Candelaria pacifica]